MPFICTIEIEGKRFDLLQCSCRLYQKYNNEGDPVSGVRGGVLALIVAGTDVDDTFEKWMADSKETKDGVIRFLNDANDIRESKIKEIKLKKAHLVSLMQSFIVAEQLDSLQEEQVLDPKLDGTLDFWNYQDLVRCQSGGSHTYLIHCGISAQVVNIDGEEHDNKW